MDARISVSKQLLIQNAVYISLPLYSWVGVILLPTSRVPTYYNWTVESTTHKKNGTLISMHGTQRLTILHSYLEETFPKAYNKSNLKIKLTKGNHPHVSSTLGIVYPKSECCFGIDHIIEKEIPSNPLPSHYQLVIHDMLLWLREINYQDTFGNSTLGTSTIGVSYQDRAEKVELFKIMSWGLKELIKKTSFFSTNTNLNSEEIGVVREEEEEVEEEVVIESLNEYCNIVRLLLRKLTLICNGVDNSSSQYSLPFLLWAALDNLLNYYNNNNGVTERYIITFKFALAHVIRCGLHISHQSQSIDIIRELKSLSKEVTSLEIVKAIITKKNNKQDQNYETDLLTIIPMGVSLESTMIVDLFVIATHTTYEELDTQSNINSYGKEYTESFLGMFKCVDKND